ncbi:MAG: LysE family transporter [Candidatus Cloacimonetes bacterium]|nr:LysE family transporter [Candidatus Cloacimonadota bacterium]
MITNFLLPGLLIGLTAGLSPGPLLTLVISETLIHGRKNGVKVALAPLFTDTPIIIITVFIFIQLKDMNTVLGFISIAGGLFLAYLGYENLKVKESQFQMKPVKDQSLKKAIITNALSPHPYIFWLSVGGSFLVKGNVSECCLFLLGFYLLLIGSKIAVAFLTDKGKSLLKSRYFIYLIRALGFVLLVFSMILIKSGIDYL